MGDTRSIMIEGKKAVDAKDIFSPVNRHSARCHLTKWPEIPVMPCPPPTQPTTSSVQLLEIIHDSPQYLEIIQDGE